MAGSGAAAERGTLRVILPDYQFTTVPCTRGETTAQQVLAQVCEAFDNSSHYALYHRRDGAVQQLADDDRVWRSNDLEPLPVYFELPLVVSDEEVLETLMIVARKDAKDLNATTIAADYACLTMVAMNLAATKQEAHRRIEELLQAGKLELLHRDEPDGQLRISYKDEDKALPKPFLTPEVLGSFDFSFLDTNPAELARQLSIMEHELFRRIDVERELKSLESTQRSLAVKRWTGWSARLACWVNFEISQQSKKSRIEVGKHFLQVCLECKKLCNYSSLATLFLSLQNTELGQEWHKLPKKHLKIKDELEAMTTSAKDFFSLRSAMNYALGPTVPYLALIIKDITLIESQTADPVARQKVMATINLQLSRAQDRPYQLRRLYRYQRWLEIRVALATSNSRPIAIQKTSSTSMFEDEVANPLMRANSTILALHSSSSSLTDSGDHSGTPLSATSTMASTNALSLSSSLQLQSFQQSPLSLSMAAVSAAGAGAGTATAMSDSSPTSPRSMRADQAIDVDETPPERVHASDWAYYSLSIRVGSAQGLLPLHQSDSTNPFCQISYGKVRKTTEVKRNTTSPQWEEEFLFDIDDPSAKIKFHVFQQDEGRTVTKDDLLGAVELPLIAASQHWYALKKRGMRRGKIFIQVEYISKETDESGALSPSKRQRRRRANTAPLSNSSDIRLSNNSNNHNNNGSKTSTSPTSASSTSNSAAAAAAAAAMLAFGTYRGACKELDCECTAFAGLSKDKIGGPCRTCGHFPAKHENLGVNEAEIARWRQALAAAHAAALAAAPPAVVQPSAPPPSIIPAAAMQSLWLVNPDELELQAQLGEGSFAKVFRGSYRGQEVAIKVLKEKADKKALIEFQKELAIMSTLRSPHIVFFYGACFEPSMYIVLEFCHKGTLSDVLENVLEYWSWTRVLRAMIDATKGLLCLHGWKPAIVHRDLKTLNLLVDSNDTVKLSDFGLSRFNTAGDYETLKKLRGTYAYLAPELYANSPYSAKSDIFSMGVILWEVAWRAITGAHSQPYSEYEHITMPFQIIIKTAKEALRPTIHPATPEPFADLIRRCWDQEPDNRPSTEQLMDELRALCGVYERDAEAWDAVLAPPAAGVVAYKPPIPEPESEPLTEMESPLLANCNSPANSPRSPSVSKKATPTTPRARSGSNAAANNNSSSSSSSPTTTTSSTSPSSRISSSDATDATTSSSSLASSSGDAECL